MHDERPWRKGVKLHKWTEEEDDFIRENARRFNTSRMRELFQQRFGWMPTPGQYRARRQRLGVSDGVKNNELCIGSERVRGDTNRVYVKVGKGPGGWKQKAHIVYEREHGAVPDGYVVVCADRNEQNCSPDNLVAVSRSEMATINKHGLIYHDRESLELAVLHARLVKKARKNAYRIRKCDICGRDYKPNENSRRVRKVCDECKAAGHIASGRLHEGCREVVEGCRNDDGGMD